MWVFLEISSSGSGSGSNSNDFYYLPFLSLTHGVRTLPNDFLDGSFPITLPEPLPLGNVKNITTYTTAYVSPEPIARSG